VAQPLSTLTTFRRRAARRIPRQRDDLELLELLAQSLKFVSASVYTQQATGRYAKSIAVLRSISSVAYTAMGYQAATTSL
jgi:hypothetical protein